MPSQTRSKTKAGTTEQAPSSTVSNPYWEKIFACVLGTWLAVTVVKFGNPIIFSDQFGKPQSALELVFNSWPVEWGYVGIGIVCLCGLDLWSWKTLAPKWAVALPLIWFAWQLISATQTADMQLTKRTLLHFAACVSCFYLGLFALSRVQNFSPIWIGLLIGFSFILWMGLDQHFGGLERTRRAFENMNWQDYPPELRAQLDTPEFRKKITSNRIFSTFVYPNALAGGIILLLPMCLFATGHCFQRFTKPTRRFLNGEKIDWAPAFAGAAVICF